MSEAEWVEWHTNGIGYSYAFYLELCEKEPGLQPALSKPEWLARHADPERKQLNGDVRKLLMWISINDMVYGAWVWRFVDDETEYDLIICDEMPTTWWRARRDYYQAMKDDCIRHDRIWNNVGDEVRYAGPRCARNEDPAYGPLHIVVAIKDNGYAILKNVDGHIVDAEDIYDTGWQNLTTVRPKKWFYRKCFTSESLGKLQIATLVTHEKRSWRVRAMDDEIGVFQAVLESDPIHAEPNLILDCWHVGSGPWDAMAVLVRDAEGGHVVLAQPELEEWPARSSTDQLLGARRKDTYKRLRWELYERWIRCPKCGALGEELVNDSGSVQAFRCTECPYTYWKDWAGRCPFTGAETDEFHAAQRPGSRSDPDGLAVCEEFRYVLNYLRRERARDGLSKDDEKHQTERLDELRKQIDERLCKEVYRQVARHWSRRGTAEEVWCLRDHGSQRAKNWLSENEDGSSDPWTVVEYSLNDDELLILAPFLADRLCANLVDQAYMACKHYRWRMDVSRLRLRGAVAVDEIIKAKQQEWKPKLDATPVVQRLDAAEEVFESLYSNTESLQE
jgi:hypothetical protein